MPLVSDALQYRRRRAPQADGGVLIEPPPTAVGALLDHNRAILDTCTFELADRPLHAWRAEARHDLIAAALSYTRTYRDVNDSFSPDAPLLLAGHQPQLFHPGVWFKNFSLCRLAREREGVAINLVIDSDLMRSAAVRVPGGTIEEPTLESVEFDREAEAVPFEERSLQDRAVFESFGKRASQMLHSLVPQPLLGDFWPCAIEAAHAENNLGLAISRARHLQEGAWSANSLELPQSRLSAMPAFGAFAWTLLTHAPSMCEAYNGAVAEYRRIQKIRNLAHPVPNLSADGDTFETPFWLWTADHPRRRRAFVRRTAAGWRLTDREQIDLLIANKAATGVEQIASLSSQGIKLRTRALATTMFARLLLGDLFIHGIGGAKYDQVTDAIIQRFFGIEPPAYLTVTATLRLPIPRPEISGDDLRLVRSRLRELEFHPEKMIGGSPAEAIQGPLAIKRHWIEVAQTGENARQRCQAIRAANQEMQGTVAKMREKLLAERAFIEHALRAESILASREYPFCFYPAQQLRELMMQD